MRVVAVVVLLLAAGCATAPQTVPGQAAPVTATRTTGPPKTPAATGTSGTPLPPVPTAYHALEMSGFGVTVRLPVPDGWRRADGGPAGIVRTDIDLQDPPAPEPLVVLRVDLTARASGSARDGTLRNEAGLGLKTYQRLAITDVAGVGDDAVDWKFTFVRNGVTRQVVDRQIQSGTAVVAVYYSAPVQLYQRYLPVWEKAARELVIRSS